MEVSSNATFQYGSEAKRIIKAPKEFSDWAISGKQQFENLLRSKGVLDIAQGKKLKPSTKTVLMIHCKVVLGIPDDDPFTVTDYDDAVSSGS